MPIVHQWCNRGEPIYFMVFSGAWSEEEFYTAFREAEANTSREAPPLFTAVVDLTASERIPARVFMMGAYAVRHRHPANGLSIVVGASPLLRRLISAGLQMYRFFDVPLRFCDTVQEARTLSAAYIAARTAKAATPARPANHAGKDEFTLF